MASQLPKIVAGILAISALGAGLLNEVDPTQCLIRGAAAWMVGYVAGSVWNLLFASSSSRTMARTKPSASVEAPSQEPSESKEAA